MKTLGLIFAFYTLFLAVQPGLQAVLSPAAAATKSCCGSSCEPIEQEHPDQQDQPACNPFQPCTISGGFIADLVIYQYSPLANFVRSYTDHNESVPLEIPLDFWQPPRLA